MCPAYYARAGVGVVSSFSRLCWVAVTSSLLAGCGGLFPGFDRSEQPLLYDVEVSEVATQVACELREFFFDEYLRMKQEKLQRAKGVPPPLRWSIDDSAASVTLTLTTDVSGKVGYLGVNLGAISQIFTLTNQSVVTATASNSIKVPSLQASLTGKRTAKITLVVSVPQRPGEPTLTRFENEIRRFEALGMTRTDAETQAKLLVSGCSERARHLDKRLFLANWMKNYFDTINADPTCSLGDAPDPKQPKNCTYQTAQLSTGFQIVFDLNGGLAPFVAGGFIIPVSAMNLDVSPDYIHNLDVKLTLCGPTADGCDPTQIKLGTQFTSDVCRQYFQLRLLLPDVARPPDCRDPVSPPKNAAPGQVPFSLDSNPPGDQGRFPLNPPGARLR
jgi:hypothetical protein